MPSPFSPFTPASFASGEYDWLNKIPGAPRGLLAQPRLGLGGLLGDTPEQKRDVMLAMASQMLMNSGPSPGRRSFAQMMGETLAAGGQAKQQSKLVSMQQRQADEMSAYRKAQLETMEREKALEAGRAADWSRTAPRPEGIQTPADGVGPVPGQGFTAPNFSDRAMTATQSALERGDYTGATQNAQLASALAKEPNMTDDLREYRIAQAQGFAGSFFDYQRELRKAGASPGATVSVNTDKSLYGTMAEQQAKQYSELYGSAQAAPETISRAERIRQVLGQGAFTGTGANFKLEAGKAFRAAGWDFGGSDIENTEALAAEMARSTLDSIKSSGLAGSQGLTEGERAFLERAVSGQITLEPGTIKRLADLNERVARTTLKRWNETAKRLDGGQLRQLGMTQIPQPAPASGGPLTGSLTQNPDGSYNYSPGR